jgi:hypothetical protein
MTVIAEVAERAERGAALLDAREPGWAARIDLATFDIGSQCRCTLGQLYGNYGTGALVLLPAGHTAEYGFMWESYDDEDAVDSEIAALNDEWRRVIGQRQGASS